MVAAPATRHSPMLAAAAARCSERPHALDTVCLAWAGRLEHGLHQALARLCQPGAAAGRFFRVSVG